MNPGFDENKAELGVLILAVAFKMFADSDSLLAIKSARSKYSI